MSPVPFKGDPALEQAYEDLRQCLEVVVNHAFRAATRAVMDEEAKTREGPRVYLVQAEQGGPIKIGVAKDVKNRLSDLQRTSPFPLRVLRTIEGGFAKERELHAQFAEWRLHGEWFQEDCPGLVELLAAEQVRA